MGVELGHPGLAQTQQLPNFTHFLVFGVVQVKNLFALLGQGADGFGQCTAQGVAFQRHQGVGIAGAALVAVFVGIVSTNQIVQRNQQVAMGFLQHALVAGQGQVQGRCHFALHGGTAQLVAELLDGDFHPAHFLAYAAAAGVVGAQAVHHGAVGTFGHIALKLAANGGAAGPHNGVDEA